MSSLPIGLLQGRGGFSADSRFAAVFHAPAPEVAPAAPPADPLEEAFARGFDAGFETARDTLEAQMRETDAARAAIELSLARLDAQMVQDLEERLRQTVLALCEHAVLPLAVDPDGLAARITKAVSMLQRAQDEKRVVLHPDDLALVSERLPAGMRLEADQRLERGALRIETADGGVEDGPTQWRRILAEAFREC